MKEDIDFIELKPAEQWKTLYTELLGDRKGSKELLAWLEDNGFFEAPASAKHHLNTPGGLCIHSINVAMNVMELCNNMAGFKKCNVREAAAAALLHDICKTGKYRWNDNKWIYEYRDDRMLGHGEESLSIAQEFIKLTEIEKLCIRWHMGMYADQDKASTMGKAYDKYPEVMALHFADMMATHIDEKQ